MSDYGTTVGENNIPTTVLVPSLLGVFLTERFRAWILELKNSLGSNTASGSFWLCDLGKCLKLCVLPNNTYVIEWL